MVDKAKQTAPIREWSAFHAGHDIQVVLRWWLRAELYVDGRLQDARTLLVASTGVPLLTGRMPTESPSDGLIHVHLGAIWSSALEVRIGARRIRLDAPLQVARVVQELFRIAPTESSS